MDEWSKPYQQELDRARTFVNPDVEFWLHLAKAVCILLDELKTEVEKTRTFLEENMHRN